MLNFLGKGVEKYLLKFTSRELQSQIFLGEQKSVGSALASKQF
jgi:hypothetical protein